MKPQIFNLYMIFNINIYVLLCFLKFMFLNFLIRNIYNNKNYLIEKTKNKNKNKNILKLFNHSTFSYLLFNKI